MKKQIIVLSLLIIHLSLCSQNSVSTNGTCTNSLAHNAKGRWVKMADLGTINSPETYKRLDEIQNMLVTIYPQPVGVDAAWRRNNGISYFGAKKRNFNRTDGPTDYISLPHFIQFKYECGFFDYYCYEGKMIPGYPGETGAVITVFANNLSHFIGDGLADCDMNIGGLPVKMRRIFTEKWKGYDLYTAEIGSSSHSVLIHRPGMLPYIPVTRKQYLEHSITHLTTMYDEIINGLEKMPVRSLEEQEKEKNTKLEKFKKDFASDPKKLKSNMDYFLSGYQTDQQRRDEQVSKAKKNKPDIINRYKDELDKTTREGLLDSPACTIGMHLSDLVSPIFVDEDKGNMLVVDNPAYIRKDLPKHVPQFFVLTWEGMSSGVRGEVGKIIKEKFPVEKLQAMIDK